MTYYDPRLKTIVSIPGMPSNRLGQFGRTASGDNLGKTFTSSTWVYRCTGILANALAGIPWVMNENGEPVHDAHPAIHFMEEMTSEDNFTDMIRDTWSDYKLFGYNVWWKRTIGERVGMVERLPSAAVTLRGDKRKVTHIEYNDGLEMFELPRENIVLFKTYGALDQLSPDSPARVAIDNARSEQSISQTVLEHFKNYAIPPYLLQTENAIHEKDMTRYRKWWNEIFQGITRRWRVGFVGGGLKPFALRAPIKELSLKELRQELRLDLCGAFGVPPSIAGAIEASSKTTWRQNMVMFHHNQVNPDAKYFAGVLNKDLTPLLFGQPKFQFLPEKVEVLQEERTAKSERIVAEVEAGILTPQAAGELLNYSPDMIPNAPINVTNEFAKNTELKMLRKKLTRVGNGGGDVYNTPFNSDILSSSEISRVKANFLLEYHEAD